MCKQWHPRSYKNHWVSWNSRGAELKIKQDITTQFEPFSFGPCIYYGGVLCLCISSKKAGWHQVADWFKSYLSDRTFSAVMGNTLAAALSCGVTLGLYCLWVHSTSGKYFTQTQNSVHCYADDTGKSIFPEKPVFIMSYASWVIQSSYRWTKTSEIMFSAPRVHFTVTSRIPIGSIKPAAWKLGDIVSFLKKKSS